MSVADAPAKGGTTTRDGRMARRMAAVADLLQSATPQGVVVTPATAPGAPAWATDVVDAVAETMGRTPEHVLVHRGPHGGHVTARFAMETCASMVVMHHDTCEGDAGTRFRVLHADRHADAIGSLCLDIASMADAFAPVDMHHDACEAVAVRGELRSLGLSPTHGGAGAMLDATGYELYERTGDPD